MKKISLDYENNLFDELAASTAFEDITKGRKGAILTDGSDANSIPIVRTTTAYIKPAQPFLPIHHHIIKSIQAKCNQVTSLNNAMIETYDSQYCNMGFHSDQALDLADNSFICIFSCYDNPDTKSIRKLKVRDKATGECSEMVLDHNSVVIFSTETNKKFVHKIVLETQKDKCRWLGITFRLSKTFLRFVDEVPRFVSNGQPLKLATEEEQREFRRYKGAENSELDFVYPANIYYTLSVSDTYTIGFS